MAAKSVTMDERACCGIELESSWSQERRGAVTVAEPVRHRNGAGELLKFLGVGSSVTSWVTTKGCQGRAAPLDTINVEKAKLLAEVQQRAPSRGRTRAR